MSKRVIISVSGDIVTDQRVLKMAGVIGESDNDVIILGRELPDSLPIDDLPFRIKRFKMIFKAGWLFYKWLNIRILFFLHDKLTCIIRREVEISVESSFGESKA